LIGARREIIVSIDWTEFALDGHSTIAINLITRHGRATPLVWLTVPSSKLKDRRSSYEDRVLQTLANYVPAGVRVTVLADRGFGDAERGASLPAATPQRRRQSYRRPVC
jgi:hypothetical protein